MDVLMAQVEEFLETHPGYSISMTFFHGQMMVTLTHKLSGRQLTGALFPKLDNAVHDVVTTDMNKFPKAYK